MSVRPNAGRADAGARPRAGPIVKWAGGKTRLLRELVAAVPERFGRYYEPFAGGAALFFDLAPRDAVLADQNADLIATYRSVADDVDAVVRELAVHAEAHGPTYYADIRARWNARVADESSPARAAMFLYLNKTCFNGLWRVNARGAFNVPQGRYVRPRILDAAALRAASVVLGAATVVAGDFADIVAGAGAGDLVYFDPPYAPLSATARFTSYTSDGFGEADQRRLARCAHALVARGCHVVASNHDTPLVRELYLGFELRWVERSCAINSNTRRRGAVRELILRGIPDGAP